MDYLIPVVIYFLVPMIVMGAFGYLLRNHMDIDEGDQRIIKMLLIIQTLSWSGLIVIILTDLFWYWSGMATLGSAILLLGFTPLMFIVLVYCYRNLTNPSFRTLFKIASAYFLALLIIVAGIMWGVLL